MTIVFEHTQSNLLVIPQLLFTMKDVQILAIKRLLILSTILEQSYEMLLIAKLDLRLT